MVVGNDQIQAIFFGKVSRFKTGNAVVDGDHQRFIFKIFEAVNRQTPNRIVAAGNIGQNLGFELM